MEMLLHLMDDSSQQKSEKQGKAQADIETTYPGPNNHISRYQSIWMHNVIRTVRVYRRVRQGIFSAWCTLGEKLHSGEWWLSAIYGVHVLYYRNECKKLVKKVNPRPSRGDRHAKLLPWTTTVQVHVHVNMACSVVELSSIDPKLFSSISPFLNS